MGDEGKLRCTEMWRLAGQKVLDQHVRCSKSQGSNWSWAVAWHSPGQGERSVVPIDIVFETRRRAGNTSDTTQALYLPRSLACLAPIPSLHRATTCHVVGQDPNAADPNPPRPSTQHFTRRMA